MDKIINQLKEIVNKIIHLFGQSKKPQDPATTKYNQRAQTEYQRKLTEFTAQHGTPTENQDVILFAQAYEMQIVKNPASVKFPPLEDFSVTVNGDTYTVSGYLDATNSYGAQMRADMKLNIQKMNHKWVCIDKHTSIMNIYWIFIILSILIPLIGYFYYSAQLAKF